VTILYFVSRADGLIVSLAGGYHVIDDARQFVRGGRSILDLASFDRQHFATGHPAVGAESKDAKADPSSKLERSGRSPPKESVW